MIRLVTTNPLDCPDWDSEIHKLGIEKDQTIAHYQVLYDDDPLYNATTQGESPDEVVAFATEFVDINRITKWDPENLEWVPVIVDPDTRYLFT